MLLIDLACLLTGGNVAAAGANDHKAAIRDSKPPLPLIPGPGVLRCAIATGAIAATPTPGGRCRPRLCSPPRPAERSGVSPAIRPAGGRRVSASSASGMRRKQSVTSRRDEARIQPAGRAALIAAERVGIRPAADAAAAAAVRGGGKSSADRARNAASAISGGIGASLPLQPPLSSAGPFPSTQSPAAGRRRSFRCKSSPSLSLPLPPPDCSNAQSLSAVAPPSPSSPSPSNPRAAPAGRGPVPGRLPARLRPLRPIWLFPLEAAAAVAARSQLPCDRSPTNRQSAVQIRTCTAAAATPQCPLLFKML